MRTGGRRARAVRVSRRRTGLHAPNTADGVAASSRSTRLGEGRGVRGKIGEGKREKVEGMEGGVDENNRGKD